MPDTTQLTHVTEWVLAGAGVLGLLWLVACIGYRRGLSAGRLDRELDDVLGTGLPFAQLVTMPPGDWEYEPVRFHPRVADTAPIEGLVLPRDEYVPPLEPGMDDIEAFITAMRRKTDETIAMLTAGV